MGLRVTFEEHGERILARVPISLHWCRLNDTYGIDLRDANDYRNDHILDTRLRLTAQRHRGRTIGICVGGEFRRLQAPREFPAELNHDFAISDAVKVKIEKDLLSAAIDLVKELPWSLTNDRQHLRVEVNRNELTTIPTLGLHFHLSLTFRSFRQDSRPVEFDWGTPGVYSSGFESNRRKH